MVTGNVVPLLVLALLLVGCSADLPTAAVDYSDDNLVAQSAEKASITKGTVLAEGEGLTDTFYLDCLNGGEGEWVDFVGSGRWVSDIVVTPSGNEHYNGWAEEWDLQLTGQTTGNVWTGGGMGHIAYHVQADGHTIISEPLIEILSSDSMSKRLRLLWRFWINTARGDTDISFEITTCNLVGK